ncbi:hypothetical protein CFIO01_00207 [Colletotrichum fioriniae PJ7]|uniref:Uncharacterized protein n=1 Tax=Colletotrichum fioriniae PJ7 TaxID=1445577 RepID=A0A010QEB0_9PEZI|nr:hypothetical protein CFIO01_00207 [Colletotrichum fioriniae PJ7]
MTPTETDARPADTNFTSTADHKEWKSATAKMATAIKFEFHTKPKDGQGFNRLIGSERVVDVYISRKVMEKVSPFMLENMKKEKCLMEDDVIESMLILFDIAHGGKSHFVPEEILAPQLRNLVIHAKRHDLIDILYPHFERRVPKDEDRCNFLKVGLVEMSAWAAWEIKEWDITEWEIKKWEMEQAEIKDWEIKQARIKEWEIKKAKVKARKIKARGIYHEMVNHLGFICKADGEGNILGAERKEPMKVGYLQHTEVPEHTAEVRIEGLKFAFEALRNVLKPDLPGRKGCLAIEKGHKGGPVCPSVAISIMDDASKEGFNHAIGIPGFNVKTFIAGEDPVYLLSVKELRDDLLTDLKVDAIEGHDFCDPFQEMRAVLGDKSNWPILPLNILDGEEHLRHRVQNSG